MKFWLADSSGRWVGAAALAASLLVSACGGGGGGDEVVSVNEEVPVAPSVPQSAPAPSAVPSGQPPSASVAGVCTPEGQKQFVRSYMDEVYLWYDEIPTVDPASHNNVPDYFKSLLVRTPDSTGQPRDRFSAVLTTSAADALQSSGSPSSELLSAFVATRSVPLAKVVTSPAGRSVGYVLFNDHETGAQDALIGALTDLRDARVQDLVLDMRYNSGGYLYIARTAASMVVDSQASGRVFEQLRYNKKRQAESTASTYFFSDRVQSAEARYPAGSRLPQLGLPRLYVLASALTCSASESIINSLRGIDVQVVLVGETTCGKPYGFRRKDNCGLAFYPIEFQGYNAKDFGDFANGFAPTCAVRDDLDSPLGAPNEPLLAAALHHADSGACPPSTAARSSNELLSRSFDQRPREHAPPPGQARAPWNGKMLRP